MGGVGGWGVGTSSAITLAFNVSLNFLILTLSTAACRCAVEKGIIFSVNNRQKTNTYPRYTCC